MMTFCEKEKIKTVFTSSTRRCCRKKPPKESLIRFNSGVNSSERILLLNTTVVNDLINVPSKEEITPIFYLLSSDDYRMNQKKSFFACQENVFRLQTKAQWADCGWRMWGRMERGVWGMMALRCITGGCLHPAVPAAVGGWYIWPWLAGFCVCFPKLPVCEFGKSNSRATWEAEKLFMKNANRSAATSVSCLYFWFLTWAWNYLLVCYLMAAAACCRWKRWLFKCRLLQADALNNNQRNKYKWHFLVIPFLANIFRGNTSPATFSQMAPNSQMFHEINSQTKDKSHHGGLLLIVLLKFSVGIICLWINTHDSFLRAIKKWKQVDILYASLSLKQQVWMPAEKRYHLLTYLSEKGMSRISSRRRSHQIWKMNVSFFFSSQRSRISRGQSFGDFSKIFTQSDAFQPLRPSASGLYIHYNNPAPVWKCITTQGLETLRTLDKGGGVCSAVQDAGLETDCCRCHLFLLICS